MKFNEESKRMRIAVILPCYNEEAAIARTVEGFRAALPEAEIYVFDNCSIDATARMARAAGAKVRTVRLAGKGNVVRRMFADVDADYYVMADGDATYDAAAAPSLIEAAIAQNLDMVVGCRQALMQEAYRPGHQFGNRVLTAALAFFFGKSFNDILSGYRVFSRRFVKSFPAFARGFEIETELSVHALSLRMPTHEVETSYFSRPEGSESKLSTYRDGARILSTILGLVRQERPLLFFGVFAAICAIASVSLAIPLATTYLETGLVPRFPTAILSASLMLLASLLFLGGLILDTVVRGRRETLHLAYLALQAPADLLANEGSLNGPLQSTHQGALGQLLAEPPK